MGAVLSTCYETVHCTVSPKFTREFGATCLLCFAQFTPPSKRRKAPKTARTRCPCRFSNPSECNKLHPPPFARGGKRFIYIIWRGLAALSKSKNSVSCETLHILDTRVGATANAFVLLKFSIKEPLQLQQRMLRLRQPSGCCPYR